MPIKMMDFPLLTSIDTSSCLFFGDPTKTTGQVTSGPNGAEVRMALPDALAALLPSQAGQGGKVLGTNGAAAGWVAGGGGSSPPMGASGPSHAAGLVPDPGATAGTTRYLREDATFAVPPGTGGSTPTPPGGTNGQIQYNNAGAFGGLAIVPVANLPAMVGSGVGHAAGLAPDPGPTAGGTRFLCETGFYAVPTGGAGTSAPFFAVTNFGISVANTITPSTIFNSATINPGSLTIPANRLALGSVIRMFLWGDYDGLLGSSITWAVTLGGVTVLTGDTSTMVATVTGKQWRTSEPTCLVVLSTGPSGKISGHGAFAGLQTSSTENFTGAATITGGGGVAGYSTIDTTAALAIDVTVQWSFANPANRIRLLGGSCWIDG